MFLAFRGLDFQECICQSQYFLESICMRNAIWECTSDVGGGIVETRLRDLQDFICFGVFFQSGITTRFSKLWTNIETLKITNTKKWFHQVLLCNFRRKPPHVFEVLDKYGTMQNFEHQKWMPNLNRFFAARDGNKKSRGRLGTAVAFEMADHQSNKGARNGRLESARIPKLAARSCLGAAVAFKSEARNHSSERCLHSVSFLNQLNLFSRMDVHKFALLYTSKMVRLAWCACADATSGKMMFTW